MIAKLIKKIIHKPSSVFLIVLAFVVVNLLIDNTIIQIFKLKRDLSIVQNRTEEIENNILKVQDQIKKSSDPAFIEKEARERFDFLHKGELIFIFPDNI